MLCAWAESKITGAKFANYQTIGVLRDGKIAAVAVYHEYRHPSIEMSFAADSPRWATRQVIYTLMAYPFDQLEVRRVTAITRKKNRKIRRLIEGIGFKLEGTLRFAYDKPNDDACVYGFFRENLEKLNGKENTRSPEAT